MEKLSRTEKEQIRKDVDALIVDEVVAEIKEMKEVGVDVTPEEVLDGIQETAEAMIKE